VARHLPNRIAGNSEFGLHTLKARHVARIRISRHQRWTAASIRQLLRSNAHVIRLRIFPKLHGLDVISALARGLHDAMHAIHNRTARNPHHRVD